MAAQASAGVIETYLIGKLGTDALAGMSLVFPAVMLMQMMSAGAVCGGMASAIARPLAAGGAWFGRLGWPATTAHLLRRLARAA